MSKIILIIATSSLIILFLLNRFAAILAILYFLLYFVWYSLCVAIWATAKG